ncbi:MAG: HAD-IC family P-type ATPase, partial [Gemmatimonadota bacterium]
GGDVLERLSQPGELILDKTGTLTEGEPVVVEWHGPESVRALVVSLESGSSHPIAASFRRAWPELVVENAAEARHEIGHGITGLVSGHRVAVGSPAFITTLATGTIPKLSDVTLTPVVVSVDGDIVAIAGIGDRARSDAAPALDALRRDGWHTMLLSGDDPRVAAAMGAQLGFAAGDVTGAATPERKLTFVRERIGMRNDRAPVVMVGDGVNDAAAIAAASVGVGVQGGAEACLATADVYLTTPGLESLVRLMEGSRRAMAVIRRNILWALAYNMVGITLAMTGHIRPILAALLMPASSLTVVLSSWLGRTFVAAPAPVDGRNA